MDSLHELANTIKESVARFKALQPQFENYIKNKEIPLELRWSLWENAPTEMKRTAGWCNDLEFEAFRLLGINPQDAVCYDGKIVDCDRYRTVTAAQILDCTENYCAYSDISEEDTKAVMGALKEEILESNMHSAKYDW